MSIFTKKTATNKRRYPRIRIYHLVKYRQLSVPGAATEIGGVKDISGGGACLLSDKKLAPGNLIELRINFPRISTPVLSQAKVTWVKWMPRLNQYKIGLQYLDIEENLRNEVVRRLENVRKMAGK